MLNSKTYKLYVFIHWRASHNDYICHTWPSSPFFPLLSSEWVLPGRWQHYNNMSCWHCSGDELAVCRRQQSECERAQEALSQVTSCFQQLLTSLGSSADSTFLREEIEQTRRVAHQLCMGTDSRPSACLSHLSSLWPWSVCRSVTAPGPLVVRVWLCLLEPGGQTNVGATLGSVPVSIWKFPVWSADSLFSDWTFSSDTAKGQKLPGQHRSADMSTSIWRPF